jgi:hypothetical protein
MGEAMVKYADEKAMTRQSAVLIAGGRPMQHEISGTQFRARMGACF